MSVTNPKTRDLQDPGVPAARLLLEDAVPRPLTAIFAEAGVTIEEAVATQVTWWPGKLTKEPCILG